MFLNKSMHHNMGRMPVQILFLLAISAELCVGIPPEIDPLRLPQMGSSGHHILGISCLSWRLAVETHNRIEWDIVPRACENYVGDYMLGGQYGNDSAAVVHEAITYAESLKLGGDGKDIWVFDIDMTSLSLLAYYAENGFGANPFNKTSYDIFVDKGDAPALPETFKLYKKLLSLGIKVVFITGKSESKRNSTAANLRKEGYDTWEKLILKPASFKGSTTAVYKTYERKQLEKSGYRIVGNIGDQWSDILGTPTGNRTFKLPNPMFYIS